MWQAAEITSELLVPSGLGPLRVLAARIRRITAKKAAATNIENRAMVEYPDSDVSVVAKAGSSVGFHLGLNPVIYWHVLVQYERLLLIWLGSYPGE